MSTMTERDKQLFLNTAMMHCLPAVVEKYSDPEVIIAIIVA